MLGRSETGYRLKATTPDGRDVARWVSDCPLAVTLHAMLWLGQASWVVRQAKGSLPLQKILDEVPLLAPRGAHPQQAIDVLRLNFPPKPTESDVTGAQIDLRSQEEPIVARRALPGPVATPASEVPIEKHLREAIRGLKALLADKTTASGFERPVISLLLNLGVTQIPNYGPGFDRKIAVDVTNGLIGQLKSFLSGATSPEDAYEQILAGLGVRSSAPQESVDDDLEELEPAPAKSGYRALGVGEIPPGMSPEQVAELEAMTVDDPGVRAKLEKTAARAQREHERVERALANRRRAAEAAAAAAAAQPAAPALAVPVIHEPSPDEAGSAPDLDEDGEPVNGVASSPSDDEVILRTPQ